MKNKRRIFIITLVILIVVAWIWWWKSRGKETAEGLKPDIKIISAQVTSISGASILISGDALVTNNLPVALESESMEMRIWLDSLMIIESIIDETVRIKSRDSLLVKVPMEIKAGPLKKLERYLKNNPEVDSLDIRTESIINLKLPISGERQFTLNLEQRIPAIRLPEVSVGKIDIEKLGLNESDLKIRMRVVNVNKFPLQLHDATYIFKVDSQLTFSGELTDLDLPSKGSGIVITNADIRTLKFGKLTWKYLFDKKDTRFEMLIKGKLSIKNNILEQSDMTIIITGTLQELKDAADFYSGE